VGLVGPNGAGKTTLLEMIIGPRKPTEGHIEVFGEATHANTAATLARVGYVAQNHPPTRPASNSSSWHICSARSTRQLPATHLGRAATGAGHEGDDQ
jgi:ABC-type Mn2+/Zn2+ transport system ATPase subunit